MSIYAGSKPREYRIFVPQKMLMTPIKRLRSYLREQSHTLRQLLHIGTPIILGQLGIISVNFADTIMVGKYSTELWQPPPSSTISSPSSLSSDWASAMGLPPW